MAEADVKKFKELAAQAKENLCLRVMAYFKDSDHSLKDQSLYLALTLDGLKWKALNKNNPVYTVEGIGSNLIRDPYIVKKADGTYLMIATDWTLYGAEKVHANHRLYDGSISKESSWDYETDNYWDVNTTCLIFADSPDMIHWSNPRQIQMVSDELKKEFYKNCGNYMHCWAPEVVFDTDEKGNAKVIHVAADGTEYRYGVIWSGDGEENGHRKISDDSEYNETWVNWTNDFETFTPGEIYFANSSANIDASVLTDTAMAGSSEKKYYLFFKDQVEHQHGIGQVEAESLDSHSFDAAEDFSNVVYSKDKGNGDITKVTGSLYNEGEGPFAFRPYKDRNLWYLFVDCHDAHAEKVFGAFSSTDLKTWKSENDATEFPDGVIRHGSTVSVTLEEAISLVRAFGLENI